MFNKANTFAQSNTTVLTQFDASTASTQATDDLPEEISAGFVPDMAFLDQLILSYLIPLGNFALTQLASASKYFHGLVSAAKPDGIAAPNQFAWFIGAVMSGGTTQVKEHLRVFPGHATQWFVQWEHPNLVEWTNLKSIDIYVNHMINAINIATHICNDEYTEDMVLALAPHNSNFSIDNYEALPRVVAKYYRKSQQTCVICDAFRTNKFEFLEKLYGIIPEVFETADMKNDMQDEILYATEKGNRDKVIWAIDHGWMRAERVVRMVARYGYNDLAAELRWKYNVPV